MRILAIDYGRKRTGIAVTDPMQIIAQGLTTVDTHMALVFLKDYLQKEPVETIIVGEPRNLDDSVTDATTAALDFVKNLKRPFPTEKFKKIDSGDTFLFDDDEKTDFKVISKRENANFTL